MPTLNEQVRSKILLHSHYLAQFENSQVALVTQLLEKAHVSIEAKIEATEGEFTKAWLKETLVSVDAAYKEAKAAMQGQLFKNLHDFAAYESGWIAQMLNKQTQHAVGLFTGVAPVKLWAAISTSPADDKHLLKDLMDRQDEFTRTQVANAIRQSVIEGETIEDLVVRLRGQVVVPAHYINVETGKRMVGFSKAELKKFHKAGKAKKVPGQYVGGVMATTTQGARVVARTACLHVSNVAQTETYKSNDEVIKGLQIVATLDTRTCLVCGSQDGKVVAIDAEPIPPFHHQCRCLRVPILKSWDELGIKGFNEAPASVRSSMNGDVPDSQTYAEWLQGQDKDTQVEALGKHRAGLLHRGVSQTRFVNNGKVLTLKELKKVTMPVPAKRADAIRAAISKLDTGLQNEFRRLKKEKEEVDAEAKVINALILEGRRPADRIIAWRDRYKKYEADRNAFEPNDKKRRAEILEALSLPVNKRSNCEALSGYSKLFEAQAKDVNDILRRIVSPDVFPKVLVKGKPGRAYYQPWDRTIRVGQYEDISTLVHEAIHDIEHNHPEISVKTKAFLLKRANGEQPKKLSILTGKNYKANEIAYEDEFAKRGGVHYSGKVYNGPATELLTTGAERLLEDPEGFAREDPEYFDFIINILQEAGK